MGLERMTRRLFGWLWRGRLDAQLREEIEQHLEMRRRRLEAEGLDPESARVEARRQFGNPLRVREEAREMWTIRWLDAVILDVRYALRLLRRAPGFTAVAVLSLSLGITSAAAVFAITDGVLLRRLAVRAPGELREIRAIANLGGVVKDLACLPGDAFERLRTGSAGMADVIGFRQANDAPLAGAGSGPRRVRVEIVSDEYFEVLSVPPAAGRLLTRVDATVIPVPLVISERLWRAAFDGDAAIAGRTITLNGTPASILGVASAFRGVSADLPADVFVPAAAPLRFDPAPICSGFRGVVRLHPGSSASSAAQRMVPLFKGDQPTLLSRADLRVALLDASHGIADTRAPIARPLWIGLALAGVLVLVACANTGGLLAARFAARREEFGLRVAIGAGSRRLIQLLAIEALVIGVLAGGAAVVAAPLVAPVLLAWIPVGDAPPAFELQTGGRQIAFTATLATVAALLAAGSSLMRLLRSDRGGLQSMNSRAVIVGRRRATRVLIAAQVACSLVLLGAAAAMTRTLINLHRINPGFDPDGVLTVAVDAAGRTADPDLLPAYYSQLLARVSAAPHVARASLAQFGLMTAAASNGTVEIAGWSPASDADRWTKVYWVGPDYFETLGMRVIAGQSLGSRESAGKERVAVVSQEFARFYFGSPGAAIGRTINRNIRIVGVVADARYHTLRDAPSRAMFVPHTQAPPRSTMTLLVRPEGDPAGAAASLMTAIAQHDPQLRGRITSIEELIGVTLARERFVARLAAILSILAVLLAAAGLYAAVSYSVSERRHELAVRLALGATGADVLRLMARDPLRTTLAGIAIGAPGIYATHRALAALLFDVPRFDLTALGACAAGLLAIAAVAALWPARRATAIDPQECLKVV